MIVILLFSSVASLRTVPVGERLSAWVSGRITGSNKLNPLQFDPSLVRGAVESSMFHHLQRKNAFIIAFYLTVKEEYQNVMLP